MPKSSGPRRKGGVLSYGRRSAVGIEYGGGINQSTGGGLVERGRVRLFLYGELSAVRGKLPVCETVKTGVYTSLRELAV